MLVDVVMVSVALDAKEFGFKLFGMVELSLALITPAAKMPSAIIKASTATTSSIIQIFYYAPLESFQ